jgi:hypothetical protein
VLNKTKLFNKLLVTAPNKLGGLIFINHDQEFYIDNKRSTGMYYEKDIFSRGVHSPSEFFSLLMHRFSVPESMDDIHSITYFKKHFYVVVTEFNKICKFSLKGKLVKSWKFPGENDSWHINSICHFKGRIIFSAFCDFKKTREYKKGTLRTGFVQDLSSGKKIITGLSQPHSLVAHEEYLILAYSEDLSIKIFDSNYKLKRNVHIGQYTRGILVDNDAIYIGLSASRNKEFARSLDYAKILALDTKLFKPISSINLSCKEIYEIQKIYDSENLIEIIATASDTQSKDYRSSIDEKNALTKKRDSLAKERDALAKERDALAKERDALAKINQELLRKIKFYEDLRYPKTIKDLLLKVSPLFLIQIYNKLRR